MDNNTDRQMHTGNWQCSSCGNAITELPFEPSPDRLDQLLCRDCHREKRGNARPERQMHEGNWKCGKCGADINQLPFEPDPERLDQLLCRDCHRAGRE